MLVTCLRRADRDSDLLRRHRANHFEHDSPAKRSKTRGQRVCKACSACAAVKLKCADTRPCPRCVTKNISCENEVPQELAIPSIHSDAAQPDILPIGIEPLSDYNVGLTQPSEEVPAAQQLATPFTDSYGDLPNLLMDGTFSLDDAFMGDFLRDIVYPNTNPNHAAGGHSVLLPDVLDFGFDTLIDLPPSFDGELPPVATYEAESIQLPRSRSGAVTPTVRKVIDIGEKAFRDSLWLWTPASGDNRSAEQIFLTISEDRFIRDEQHLHTSPSLDVSLASRDRLLSMILGTCEPAVMRHVLSRFPSGELISSILTHFVTLRFDEVGRWIHTPSLNINQDNEAFLAALLSVAAVESRHPDIRRLGFAVQEAARIGVADRFESDNRNTRDLRTVQAFSLQLHAGFWSGMRRKMEIAESFTFPLVTMLRRSGHFRKRASSTPPDLDGPDASIEEAWDEWIRIESFKRLAYQVLIQDTNISMSLLTQPLLSMAEFHLDLPCSPAMWTAASAHSWKPFAVSSARTPIPTIRDALSNLSLLRDHQSNIDVQLSLNIIVSSLWPRVWQFRQMHAMPPIDGCGSNSLTANSLHQELVLGFKYLKIRSEEWEGGISPPVALKLEVCLMHLHVSLEAIQIFGGKEGEAEARKTVPQLKTWSRSREAREALRSAGQTLKAASQLEAGTLRGFAAVAVYHASLVLWAYGILVDSTTQSTGPPPSLVQLDDLGDSPDLERFLLVGHGLPCIRNYSLPEAGSSGERASTTIRITDSLNTMNAIAALLPTTSGGGDERGGTLPIVANLNKLMRALGKAASVMKRPQTGDLVA